jgi:hypothetical protein
MALITSARVGGHDANPINSTVSSALEFAWSSLAIASDEQYESVPDDEIALLARKFRALHRFHKERRYHLGAALNAATPPTSSLIAPRGRSSTPSTRTTTGTILATRATTRRSTVSRTRRRSFRRSCPERLLP